MMRLTIIGFGNQAFAWAQNLQDSGFPFRVALRPQSPSMELAQKLGFPVVEIGSPDFYQDKAYVLLTPDHTHSEFMGTHGNKFNSGSAILYAHGFSLLKNDFHLKYPKIQHVLFAPKSIGSELRHQYEIKGKLGAVYSLEYFHGEAELFQSWLLKLATALGINMGPFKTTFKNETQADLYSEQGLLCSLIPYAAGEMFKHLVDAGIEPELAYFECWHELKLIVNAMVDKGPEDFFDLISPNALIGSEKGYKRLFTPEFHENLESLFTEIQNEKFNFELDEANISETRKVIKERWQQSSLMKTYKNIQRNTK
jgi:ketol-acid reductoisomerase